MNRLPLSVTVSIVVRTGMSAVSLYAHEAVLTTLLLVAAAAMEAWAPPLSTPFFERGDASISYPAIAPTCPVWLLILLSVSVPFFSTLVSLITSTCYLVCAYALPAYFTLILIGDKLDAVEKLFLRSLIPASFIFSALGLYASVVTLANDLSGGEGGWGSKRS